MAKPDQNQVLRQLPIAAGILAGILLLTNRILTPDLTESQSRSDVVGVILSGVMILVGLLWQQVQPRLPDSVELVGTQQFELAPDLPESVRAELAWVSHCLLTNTVTQSVVILDRGRVLLRRGILPPQGAITPGTIVKKAIESQKAIYLVALKLYPGRLEFDYLPENTQGVICQPIGQTGVLILGANAPRSYTKQDENWIATIAQKLAYGLESVTPETES